MRRALPLLILLLLAVAPTARAQGPDRTDRESAEEALANVESLLDGDLNDKRGLTPALAVLARTKADLGTTDKRRANRILARPEGGTGPGAWAPLADEDVTCTTHFCVHWVTGTGDAPPSQDTDLDGDPDFVEFVAGAFEQSYTTEVGTLGWTAPLPDEGRGGSNLVDVYLSDIGDDAYGYAVPESNERSTSSYLVLDNDYAAAQFSRYGGDYEVPVEATAAHEFNHTLQFVYDSYQDTWMLESTATWAEEKVFDDANDYRFYLGSWAIEPDQPLTYAGDGEPPLSDDRKMYGSAIWNHWLERRYAAQVVRRAWAISQANSVAGFGFAPRAYDKAIRDSCGPGLAFEFMDFTAAVAEWDAPNSGIREGSTFEDDVKRVATPLAIDAPATGTLDHAAFRLYDIPPPSVATLYLSGGLPAGIPGSIALVGRSPAGTMTKALGILDPDGQVTVSLDNPAQYEAITAVVTNADTSAGAYDEDADDWAWANDNQAYTLTATATTPDVPAAGPLPSFTPCQPVDPGPEPSQTPTPSATASPTPTPTVTPTPTPVPATSLRLSRSTTRIRSAVRTGVLALFARSNKGGRLAAASSVDRTTARRLKVGRRTTSTGTGRRTLTAPGRFKVNVRLTRKARSALKRHRNRTVRIRVVVTFVPADGTRAVRRTLSVLLRP